MTDLPTAGRSPRVLHLAHVDEWAQANRTGWFDRSTRGAGLAEVGFIHASAADQIAAVAERFYADDPEPLLLLVIDAAAADAAGTPLIWEDGGEGEHFPHLYGRVPVDAVVAALPVGFDAVGRFVPPDLAGLDVVRAGER